LTRSGTIVVLFEAERINVEVVISLEGGVVSGIVEWYSEHESLGGVESSEEDVTSGW